MAKAQTPAEKGDALQQAVHLIEQCILRTSPNLKERPFLIEEKKTIKVEGVRHEIDVFVTVHLADGYRAIYIFECKNWKRSVGKNEIVAFAEKIEVLNAAHGYFVAKSFSKDAKAQAKKNGRITLRVASETDITGQVIPGYLHLTETIAKGLGVRFVQRIRRNDGDHPIDIQTAHADLDGVNIDLSKYLVEWGDEIMRKDSLSFPSLHVSEGDHARSATGSREFRTGELVLNGEEIESATATVNYQISVYRPPIISSFDVESRGRLISLAPVKSHLAGTVQMRIVQHDGALINTFQHTG